MIALLREMFLTPEAQAGAYAWAAVLLAHVAIGALLAALLGLAVGAGRAALIVAGAYLVLWEGGQLAFAGAGLTDCLIDASAVAGGALLAATLWTHARLPLAAVIAALAGLLVAGIRRRGPTDRKDLP